MFMELLEQPMELGILAFPTVRPTPRDLPSLFIQTMYQLSCLVRFVSSCLEAINYRGQSKRSLSQSRGDGSKQCPSENRR